MPACCKSRAASRRRAKTRWDGLWAVEPHLGKEGRLGAKWEELLVIQDGRVSWLDDDTPHVRYWRSHGVAVD